MGFQWDVRRGWKNWGISWGMLSGWNLGEFHHDLTVRSFSLSKIHGFVRGILPKIAQMGCNKGMGLRGFDADDTML